MAVIEEINGREILERDDEAREKLNNGKTDIGDVGDTGTGTEKDLANTAQVEMNQLRL